jgi:hypothetical protein
VLFRTQVERRLWASDTAGKGVTTVTMEANRDLVASSRQGTQWGAGTGGNHPQAAPPDEAATAATEERPQGKRGQADLALARAAARLDGEIAFVGEG